MKTFDEHLAERESQNVYRSTKLWNSRPHLYGMIGERAICKFFCIDQDLRNRPAGDGGVDLQLLFDCNGNGKWFSVDAKCSTYGDWLRVEVGTVIPLTIYVLVYSASEECLGWIWGRDLIKAPPTPWTYNIVHAVGVGVLRPMLELKSRALGVRWKP